MSMTLKSDRVRASWRLVYQRPSIIYVSLSPEGRSSKFHYRKIPNNSRKILTIIEIKGYKITYIPIAIRSIIYEDECHYYNFRKRNHLYRTLLKIIRRSLLQFYCIVSSSFDKHLFLKLVYISESFLEMLRNLNFKPSIVD